MSYTTPGGPGSPGMPSIPGLPAPASPFSPWRTRRYHSCYNIVQCTLLWLLVSTPSTLSANTFVCFIIIHIYRNYTSIIYKSLFTTSTSSTWFATVPTEHAQSIPLTTSTTSYLSTTYMYWLHSWRATHARLVNVHYSSHDWKQQLWHLFHPHSVRIVNTIHIVTPAPK